VTRPKAARAGALTPVPGVRYGPRWHVLVVDDEQSVRHVVRTAFELEGWEVTEAEGGQQALDQLRWPPFPDVVLLDLMMPRPHGFDVLRELRSVAMTESLPVVIITAKADALSRATAEALGATDYVTKPFDIDDLVGRCAAIANRRAPRTASPPEGMDHEQARRLLSELRVVQGLTSSA
jgi:two-component system OmpR family response regulator